MARGVPPETFAQVGRDKVTDTNLESTLGFLADRTEMNTSIAAETKRRQLRQRIAESGLIVAPGVFDMISARIADRMGFDVLYMTGYGAVASYLGLPDAGLASYTDMVNRASAFAQGMNTPLIADADTG